MKKLSLIIVFLSFFAFAQAQSKADIFNTDEIVWCGLDYSNVKLIGGEGFNDLGQIKSNFFNSWNNLVINEVSKYDFKKHYQKSSQVNDLSVARDRNTLPKASELVTEKSYSISKDKLANIVNAYDLADNKSGVGLVYVMESLSKRHENAVLHVVFFDLASRKILWSKKYDESPRGFGFRNYWAYPIYKAMVASGKDYKKGL